MIVYGKQPILYLLQTKPDLIRKIFLSKKVDRNLFHKLRKFPIQHIDNRTAQSLSKGGNHQGILAEVDEVELQGYRDILDTSNFVVILHSITDIGNIGSIIRTSYSLGVDGVIITGLKSLKLDGVVRTSAGAVFSLDVALYPNIYDVLNELKQSDWNIFGATLSGEDIRKIDIPNRKVLILGSEGEGLPNRVIQLLDREVTIKMDRDFDSLNVAVASAILIDRMR